MPPKDSVSWWIRGNLPRLAWMLYMFTNWPEQKVRHYGPWKIIRCDLILEMNHDLHASSGWCQEVSKDKYHSPPLRRGIVREMTCL